MSGVEPALVLEIISTTIELIRTGHDIYHAAHGLGVPAFSSVSENMPVVSDILSAVHNSIDPEGAPSTALVHVQQMVQTCHDDVGAITHILEKVTVSQDEPLVVRYKKAIASATPGKREKVETLMKEIMVKLQLLQTHHIFNMPPDSVSLQSAIDRLAAIQSSLPDEAGPSYNMYGQGPQNIGTDNTTIRNNFTYGSGSVNNVERYDGRGERS
ncbi:hypothetical protein K461DRAFT_34877 [Myriangium duriaei CBS 260.36]|uniref:NACHT-NTPase and P-loop NTPases N-terminal domain-containing protein n=1 Tax=Myriangium duriaei CBS 260.36 TaxID=1168546 RepID=A0A9P4ME55_9PEZI|nr:hypothetical protein K461DRAFT_34877 [Myriangium duriaei CBS 260.36]